MANVSHYALRRLNPYRGVVMVVDAGDALAVSHDGVTWHLRADDGYGWVRPTGVWVEGEGLKTGAGRQNQDLIAALRALPELPFPLADRLELWLLDQAGGRPLALLDARRPNEGTQGAIEPIWLPFVPSYTAFRSETLARHQAEQRSPTPHAELLARMVNQAAHPRPVAQWFLRGDDGGGEGLDGLRVPAEWQGRELDAAAFPELLLPENWNNLLEQSVISDYHLWLAPLLLLLPAIRPATRDRLEQAASRHPRWLARVHRLLPAVADAERLRATLVAARIEQAQEASAKDPF